jgi:alkylated DNA nucleotide flippase Atl1
VDKPDPGPCASYRPGMDTRERPKRRRRPAHADHRWAVVDDVTRAIPLGRWVAYGEVAELVGMHPVPLGRHLVDAGIVHAHRVLQADGSISPRLAVRSFESADAVRARLVAEGVVFTHGRASQAQRIDGRTLGRLVESARHAPPRIPAGADAVPTPVGPTSPPRIGAARTSVSSRQPPRSQRSSRR